MLKEREELHELVDRLPEKVLLRIKEIILQNHFDEIVEEVEPTDEEKKAIDEALADDEVYSFEEAFKGIE